MKEQLRLFLKKIRDNIKPEYRLQAERKIQKHFIELINNNFNRCIGGYYPIYSEVNVIPILKYVEGLGKLTCLPSINGKVMEFRAWKYGDHLSKNGNLFEPLESSPLAIPDVLIVPLLGFDRDANRIGYGRGYYDNYMKNRKSLLKVGIAFASQEVLEGLPVDGYDEKLDYIITEHEIGCE